MFVDMITLFCQFSFLQVSDTDPYEAAVVSLPSAVKELLLRILHLRIGTRYDVSNLYIRSLLVPFLGV